MIAPIGGGKGSRYGLGFTGVAIVTSLHGEAFQLPRLVYR
jgi:hypothetical protein